MTYDNVCKVCKIREPMSDWDHSTAASSGICFVCWWNKCQHCGEILEDHDENYKCMYDTTTFVPENKVP